MQGGGGAGAAEVVVEVIISVSCAVVTKVVGLQESQY